MINRLNINKFLHPIFVKYVMRAYDKKVERKFKERPDLSEPVDAETTQKHLALYQKLGYPCSDKWLRLFSNLTGIVDYRYIPQELFYGCIERVLNDCNRAGSDAEDKNQLSIFIPKEHLPRTIVRFIRGIFMDEEYKALSEAEVKALLCQNQGELIGKVAVESLGGKGVTKFDYKDGVYSDLSGIVLSPDWIRENHDSYILQKRVNQCPFSAKFNESSTNTCRIITLRCPWDGQIVVTKVAMRMGINQSAVDNLSSGGIALALGPRGELNDRAYSWEKLQAFERHPSSGVVFKGEQHPYYEKMCKTVIVLAEKMPNYNLLSWDVVIDDSENVIVIEVNQNGQGTNILQFGFGSVLGDYTEKIVDWIAAHKQYDKFNHFRTFNY